MSSGPSWDVVIVGAGPAGSTAAALLARDGHRVLVLEKNEFPRFHIGESLLPSGMAVLKRLQIEPDSDTFVHKRGAEFVCEESRRHRKFHFDEALAGCPPSAWHVERSRFDTMIRDRAVAAGAEVRHGETVLEVLVDEDQVRVRTGTGNLTARYVVDASGQDRLLARQSGSSVPYRQFGAAAVFTHFDGISDDAMEDLGSDNDIRIVIRPEGWGWMIPLPGRRLSVGVVSKAKITPDDLDAGILQGPLARRWTDGAERLETSVIRNFSYRNESPSGSRFAAVGDASCFLDPVFSSGVMLAMRGAEGLADVLGPALTGGTEASRDLMTGHNATMDRGYRTFSGLIDRFYNSKFPETVFLGDPTGMPMRSGVMSVLAGDVWRDDNPFQDILLRARRRNAKSL